MIVFLLTLFTYLSHLTYLPLVPVWGVLGCTYDHNLPDTIYLTWTIPAYDRYVHHVSKPSTKQTSPIQATNTHYILPADSYSLYISILDILLQGWGKMDKQFWQHCWTIFYLLRIWSQVCTWILHFHLFFHQNGQTLLVLSFCDIVTAFIAFRNTMS